MNRDKRIMIAKQTIAICEAGFYKAPTGKHVSIIEELEKAKAGTVLYSPDTLPKKNESMSDRSTQFEIHNETTLHAMSRLAADYKGHLACLNFASAKNPGGGFLNGSFAQEESLASSSGLYPCLLQAPEYYKKNRANRSLLYLDMLIYSPLVPFFREDNGKLLEIPFLASVITAPAPNAGAIMQNEPESLINVESALRRRAELILEIAQLHKIDFLVLGAWGCGVFRNDPRIVARIFRDLLKSKSYFYGIFSKVVFAVFDRSANENAYRSFLEEF